MAKPDPAKLRELALLMLEELAIRNGSVKARYWKTYRLARFWLGDLADYVVRRLVEGGFIAVSGGVVRLAKPVKTGKTLNRVIKEAHSVVLELARML